MQDAPRPLRVWDLPLRLFHWTLVLAVAGAAFTGFLLPATWLNQHVFFGTAIAALVLFRLVWGFTGSSFSRFASFAFSPATVLAYARDQWRGRTGHFLGHNPLGAAMIAALLLCLAIIVVTGLMTLGGEEKQGPLRALVSYANGQLLRGVHQAAAFGLLAMIAAHLAGVIFESRRENTNLALAMLTGIKQAPANLTIAPPRAVAALLASAVLTIAVLVPVVALWRMVPAGVPQAALDAGYVKDCGDCHIPFHPSLRSGEGWTAIMMHLDAHFGENAGLKPDVAAAISAYLRANAAEHWDTRAANEIGSASPADQLRITEAQFWQRRHRGIDPAIFTTKKVGMKSNCEACHGDARQGLFMPQAIHIPADASSP